MRDSQHMSGAGMPSTMQLAASSVQESTGDSAGGDITPGDDDGGDIICGGDIITGGGGDIIIGGGDVIGVACGDGITLGAADGGEGDW
mmetsp:Transcript_19132/g.62494  ORF Transcript_19132/g.62494 Transcript_19132/m.62494 type:complete len:88 (+) Transcript_19132:834-1097(+)